MKLPLLKYVVLFGLLTAMTTPAGAQVQATPLEPVSGLQTSFGTLKLPPAMLTIRASERAAALRSSQLQSYFTDIETVARSKGWGQHCTRRYVLVRQPVTPSQLEAATDTYHRSLTALLQPVFGSQWMEFQNELGAQKQLLSLWRTGDDQHFANLLTYTARTKTLMIAACELTPL